MIDISVKHTVEVPPAFYRDSDPPPPPPDDPHWREWPHGDDYEPAPRWMLYGIPAFLLVWALLHFVVLLILLKTAA